MSSGAAPACLLADTSSRVLSPPSGWTTRPSGRPIFTIPETQAEQSPPCPSSGSELAPRDLHLSCWEISQLHIPLSSPNLGCRAHFKGQHLRQEASSVTLVARLKNQTVLNRGAVAKCQPGITNAQWAMTSQRGPEGSAGHVDPHGVRGWEASRGNRNKGCLRLEGRGRLPSPAASLPPLQRPRANHSIKSDIGDSTSLELRGA